VPIPTKCCNCTGIDWQAKWKEFEDEVEKIKQGKKEYLTWEDADA
jgi:hypothetical protein